MPPRKPIQIILDPSAAPHASIFALCDDGTIWHRLDDVDRPSIAPDPDSPWVLLPLIPGTFDHIKESLRHPAAGSAAPMNHGREEWKRRAEDAETERDALIVAVQEALETHRHLLADGENSTLWPLKKALALVVAHRDNTPPPDHPVNPVNPVNKEAQP